MLWFKGFTNEGRSNSVSQFFAVCRCKCAEPASADARHRVELFELFHDGLADERGRDFAFAHRSQFLRNARHQLLGLLGGNGTLAQGNAQRASQLVAVKLDAPDNAAVGDEVTVTLTNVGRLPDAYRLVAEPLSAARIPEPNQHASPGESVEVTVRINQTPVSIVLKSVGGGGGDPVGQVTID